MGERSDSTPIQGSRLIARNGPISLKSPGCSASCRGGPCRVVRTQAWTRACDRNETYTEIPINGDGRPVDEGLKSARTRCPLRTGNFPREERWLKRLSPLDFLRTVVESTITGHARHYIRLTGGESMGGHRLESSHIFLFVLPSVFGLEGALDCSAAGSSHHFWQ